ncbi:MAG TPA: RES domain-containing protein [Candidatus Elarobacter sp.]
MAEDVLGSRDEAQRWMKSPNRSLDGMRPLDELDRPAAFDGVGSSLYPGRWNERTRRVIYTTSRISLGILKIIVQSSGAPLVGYVAYPLDVPSESLATLDRSLLSRTWQSADAGRAECRVHGERWRNSGSTAGLIVPSAVIPGSV